MLSAFRVLWSTRAMSTQGRRQFTVDVNEDVTLYGVIREPATQRNKNVALLLHPHPKLGGDANNNVVSALSRTLVEDGWSTLALNTRGVGRSSGTASWTGTAEREDVVAACQALAEEGVENILVVGYSFGACIASSTIEGISQVKAVALISYPCGMAAGMLLNSHFPHATKITKPVLWVTGDSDQFHSVQQSQGKYEQLTAPLKTFRLLEGLDHFYFGEESRVCDTVLAWLADSSVLEAFSNSTATT